MTNYMDVTGKRYGKLVATKCVGSVLVGDPAKNQRKTLWEFKCDCGNTVTKKLAHVAKGDTTNCGCERASRLEALWEKNTLPYGQSSFNSLYKAYVKTAKGRDIAWGLTRDEFRTITSGSCAYCGLPPSQKRLTNKASNGEYVYNGVDRVDNSLGYYIENVVPCCGMCNMAKSSHPVNVFLEWVERVYEYQHGVNIDE